MLRLAIDTSSTTCAACIFDVTKNLVLAQNSQNIGRGHAEILLPMIKNCLATAEATYEQIEKIHVTIGPGSFTGVRVGMAVARALALSLEIPVCGISTLNACEAFARCELPKGPLVTILDANRDEAYCKISDGTVLVETYENLIRLPLIQQAYLCGSGAQKFNDIAGLSLPIIHDQSTAPIELIAQMEIQASSSPPEPLYLRKADAKIQDDFILPRAVE